MLVAFQLSLTHWFYLYLPWVLPFVVLWLLLPEPDDQETGTRSGSIAEALPVAASQSITRALDPHAALSGLEAHGQPGPHAPDRELRLDADHGVVRPGHARVGDERRPAAAPSRRTSARACACRRPP